MFLKNKKKFRNKNLNNMKFVSIKTLIVSAPAQGIRLDQYLVQTFPHTSRNYWREQGCDTIRVNEKKHKKVGGFGMETSLV